jgi:reactive intermediate/imine deaminase
MADRPIDLLQPPGHAAPGGHYSPGVAAAGLLFVSGQLPIAPDGTRLVEADFATQVRAVLANVDAILATRGLSRERLVQVRVYLVDIGDWAPFNALYAAWIGKHRPARAVVPVPALHHGFKLELEAVAALE